VGVCIMFCCRGRGRVNGGAALTVGRLVYPFDVVMVSLILETTAVSLEYSRRL